VINLDYETYSEVDLGRVGVYVYAAHPSTRVELAAWALPGQEVQQWDINDGPIEESPLWALLNDPTQQWAAWNAAFERIITRDVLDINIEIPRWHCTMQRAWAYSFSGRLDQVGDQIGLSQDKRKIAEGKKLVLHFCKPAPKSHKADRYCKDNDPERWGQYKRYNRQDVVAEREIGMLIPFLPEKEQNIWCMDQRINDRGVPVDKVLIDLAVALERKEKTRLKNRMNWLTGLDNANSTQQLIPWLLNQNIDVPTKWSKAKHQIVHTLDKDAVMRLLSGSLPPAAQEVLILRQQANLSSTKKWKAFQDCIGEDNRVRGMFQFGGAQRTQRWAGRLVQLHNLKQGYKDADRVADLLVVFGDVLAGDLLETLSNIIRAAITAPIGKKLSVVDLSAIESRVLGWLANDDGVNSIFAEGRDTYKAFGSLYYGKPEDEITPDERKFCKPPVLGCGYYLGIAGLITYAEGYGVELDKKTSRKLIQTYRDNYPMVKYLWKDLKEIMRQTIVGEVIESDKDFDNRRRLRGLLDPRRDERYFSFRLPSGRRIWYFLPWVRPATPEEIERLRRGAEDWGYDPDRTGNSKGDQQTITYMGMNQYTNKWERISTHGGKITENLVQAIARDILAEQMLNGDKYGLDIIGHVHDEMIVEVSDDAANATEQYMEQLMSWTPEWVYTSQEASGDGKWVHPLLLGADGFVTKRYRKD
jgi:DNA polymerase